MDVLGPRSTAAVFLLFVILFPIGIISADRPIWIKSQWEAELENFRQKFYPDIEGGAEGPIPELVECVVNTPKGDNVCGEFGCDEISNIPCSKIRRQVILNEILLRKQFRSFNEDCDSHGTKEGDALVTPPRSYADAANDYRVWQNVLIDSGLKF